MSVSLPPNPSINQLKRQARELLAGFTSGNAEAVSRVRVHLRRLKDNPKGKPLALQEAQMVVAREYGYPSWADLARYVESVSGDGARKAAIASLIEAANNGEVDQVVEILDVHPGIINERGGLNTRTALHFAAWRGWEDIVERLLERGADPSPRCKGDNATPLHFAVEEGHESIIDLLLENGADPVGEGDLHEMGVIGWATFFHSRRNRGAFPDVRRRTVDKLLERGVDHHIFSALAMGEENIVRSVVAKDPTEVDRRMSRFDDLDTPLHVACTPYAPVEMLSLLIELGADLEAADGYGFTPLDQAALYGQDDRAKLLEDGGAIVRVPAAFFLERDVDIQRHIQSDPMCLGPGQSWETLIVFAAERRPASVVEKLLECGASVDVKVTSRGTENYTPLHGACFDGNVEAARVLLRHGADTSAKDDTHHSTPLGWARHAGQKDLEQLLLEHGVQE